MLIEKIRGLRKLNFFQNRFLAIAALSIFLAYSVFSVASNIKTVLIVDGGETIKLQTMSKAPDDILDQAGILLSADDIFTTSSNGSTLESITIQRAFDVLISADGITKTIKMTDGNVADAIEKSGIYLDEQDILSLSADTLLSAGMNIDITRVAHNYVHKESVLGYESVTEYTDTLEKGTTQTLTAGTEGLKLTTLRQRIQDGEVVEEAVVKEEVVKEPVNEKKLVGTKVVTVAAAAPKTTESVSSAPKVAKPVQTPVETALNVTGSVVDAFKTYSKLAPASSLKFDSNARPLEYKQLITGKASAYYQDPATHSTSTGRKLMAGHVAVNPKQIPYGSKLWVRTTNGKIIYGYAIAADTGGFAKQGRITIDLFFNSESECYSFGIKDVEIYVLN